MPLTFTLTPQGPFSLDAIRDFQCGLMVASRSCSSSDEVRLAFPLDGTHAPVGVRLTATRKQIEVEGFGTRDQETLAKQVARILSVDHDGRPYAKLLDADPFLRAVAARRPGFRPPIFFSPYSAAGWLVLTQRSSQRQAAKIQEALAREAGDVIRIDGEPLASFPRPQSILSRDGFAGVSVEKWRRLQVIARAALDGELDVEALRAAPFGHALERLQQLHGIGAWTAEGVLVRGCGLADALSLTEPHCRQAMQLAYGLPTIPSPQEFAARAEAWRPYRAWVTVLLTAEFFGRLPRGVARGNSAIRARG
jgi:DNA-3-methyladenine glycosylase II